MVQQFQRLETAIGSPAPFNQAKNDELKASKKDYIEIDTMISEGGLAPEFTPTETLLRWGFVRKVYGILSGQLVLSALVSIFMMNYVDIESNTNVLVGMLITSSILSLVLLIPLYIYRQSHPTNLVLLGIWVQTLLLSVTVGAACTRYSADIVFQALLLTGLMFGGLTAYTFRATRKGADFSLWGPALYSALLGLFFWGLLQIFFMHSKVLDLAYAAIGAVVFMGYIVYDTHMIIKNYGLDEFIWAAVALYLDVIQLFLRILKLLGDSRN